MTSAEQPTSARASFISRIVGSAFAFADALEEHGGDKAGERMELHLDPRQIAALRNGLQPGDWLTGEKGAQQEGRGAYAVFGPLAIYRAAPRPFVADTLPPHQQRVVIEHAELRDKVVALAAFIQSPRFVDLPRHEAANLAEQQKHMERYMHILQARMAGFGVQA